MIVTSYSNHFRITHVNIGVVILQRPPIAYIKFKESNVPKAA